MGTEESRGKESSVPLRVLAAMMGGRAFDVAAVVQEFEVSKGAASRHLKQLSEWVPGVEGDTSAKTHVYRFNQSVLRESDKRDEPTNLAGAIAVSLASAFSRVFSNSQYQLGLLQLRKQLIGKLPTSRQTQFSHASRKFVTLGGFEESLADRSGLLDDVLDAILKSKQLRIEYEKFGDGTRSTESRTIEPYTVAVHDSHFYVVGVNAGAPPAKLRTFRFSRIADAEVLDTSFKYPSQNEYDPEVAFRDSIGIWSSSGEPVAVRIRLDPKWRTMAQHHRWHSSQKVSPCESGGVELTFRVNICPEFEKWILGFGDEAEVLEPPELRERIALRLRNGRALYEAERQRDE